MLKSTRYQEPKLIENLGNGIVEINFDYEHTTETVSTTHADGEEKQERECWRGHTVQMQHPLTRSRIIDHIVRAAYPDDVMQSIINNHLLDPDDAEDKAEFDEMQQWRKHAKAIAALVLGE